MENQPQQQFSSHQSKNSRFNIYVIAVMVFVVAGAFLLAAVLSTTMKDARSETVISKLIEQNEKYKNEEASVSTSELDSMKSEVRDTKRKNDINSLASQFEVYYAKFGSYPALKDINNPTWRQANKINGDKVMIDPQNPNNQQLLSDIPMDDLRKIGYVYKPTPVGCVSSTDSIGSVVQTTNLCEAFTLIALMENEQSNSSLNIATAIDGTTRYFYTKQSAE